MIERDTLYFRIFCITFWVLAAGNFICEEFIPAIGEDSRHIFNSAANVIFLILGLLTLRKKSDIILILIFIALGVFSSVLNDVPSYMWLDDLRRTVPTLLTLPIVRYFFTCNKSDRFRESFDFQLKIFLILQAACMLEQFIRYGAGDHGGGSLGNWNSGNISICIIILSFYFICKNWDGENYIRSLWDNRLYVLLLFPVFLNETKVSFLILIIYFVLLYPFNIKSVGKVFIATPFLILIAAGALSVYMWAIDSRDDIFSENFIGTYLTGGDNVGELMESAEEASDFIEQLVDKVDEGEWMFLDIPRFMKLGLLLPVMNDAKGGFIFGAGMGQFNDFKDTTKFVDDHVVALFGTRMMIHYTLFPMGLLGLIWAFFWYKNILGLKRRYGKMALQVKLLLLSIIVLTFFYNELFNMKVCCIIFYFICFSNTYPLLKDNKVADDSKTLNNSSGL